MIVIFQRNSIGKHKFMIARIAVIRLVESFYANLYAF